MDRVAHALELIGDLTGAKTVARAVDLFQLAVDPFGVKLFRAGVLGNPYRDRLVGCNVDNWPEEWTKFYFGSGAFIFDPTVKAANKGQGFFWSELPPAESLRGRQLMSDAVEFGMVEGFTAIRIEPGQLPTAVSMAGDQIDLSALERGVLTFVANALVSRMLYLREVQLAPAVERLTPRETQILHLAALGRHDREIAMEIGRSEHTVRDHWKAIRRKLGASDRASAVAVGIWSGEIGI
jgi:LuxR family transcriptional regulator, quorum-sensing system regulator BjaR1